MNLTKRKFLLTGYSLLASVGIAQAQETGASGAGADPGRAAIPRRQATTRVLFKAPDGLPNALAATPEGLWIGEQKMFIPDQYPSIQSIPMLSDAGVASHDAQLPRPNP
jgi:hypothetical protein